MGTFLESWHGDGSGKLVWGAYTEKNYRLHLKLLPCREPSRQRESSLHPVDPTRGCHLVHKEGRADGKPAAEAWTLKGKLENSQCAELRTIYRCHLGQIVGMERFLSFDV